MFLFGDKAHICIYLSYYNEIIFFSSVAINSVSLEALHWEYIQ